MCPLSFHGHYLPFQKKRSPIYVTFFILCDLLNRIDRYMTEKELAEKCRSGDRASYRTLYEAYSQQLMGICMRYTGDADMAHDVLHDSFVKIFSAFGQFRYMGEGSLRAWMSRITVNTALALLKKNKTLYLDDLPQRPEETTPAFNEDDYVSVPDNVLAGFIQELPTASRTVLNMYMFEDMSHQEISERLGIKEVASRVRLTRAKSLLAEKLKDYVGKEQR